MNSVPLQVYLTLEQSVHTQSYHEAQYITSRGIYYTLHPSLHLLKPGNCFLPPLNCHCTRLQTAKNFPKTQLQKQPSPNVIRITQNERTDPDFAKMIPEIDFIALC